MGDEEQELLERIERDFTYHPPHGVQVEIYEDIRARAKQFARMLVQVMPPLSRELDEALRNLEQVVMWANAGVARAGSETPDS